MRVIRSSIAYLADELKGDYFHPQANYLSVVRGDTIYVYIWQKKLLKTLKVHF